MYHNAINTILSLNKINHKIVKDVSQEWPTHFHFSFWAALEIFPYNIDFLGRISMKTVENHPEYQKITDFRSEFGPQKVFFGPHAGWPPL
jgi:hypothetical protein